MHVFIDFEASSLSDESYPIEVGWVFEDGREEGYLIRPAADWTDWDAEAEAVHGVARELLLREGTAHEVVCDRLVKALMGHSIHASSPPWDGRWLSRLLRGANRPRHLLRLTDSDEAFAEALRRRLGEQISEATIAQQIAAARSVVETAPAVHRALADARREWLVWLEVSRIQ